MAEVMCLEAMQLLNAVFGTPLILNDGHEIYARLEAGDDLADIAEEFGEKLGRNGAGAKVRRVIEGWPPTHLEAVAQMLRWALSKLDTEERITIKYKGDDQHPETVTRFELRGNELLVEFAHPPARARVGL